MDNDANKITNFTRIGLNPYMMPLNAPITRPSPVAGYNFDMQNEVQGRFIRASLVNIKRFIDLTGTSSAVGTFGSGASLFLSTTLSPDPPHQFDLNFGVPYIAVYQGTAAVGSLQIYPTLGNGIPSGRYHAYGDFDWNNWQQFNSVWSGVLENVTGGDQSILFVTQWKFITYNNTTQT